MSWTSSLALALGCSFPAQRQRASLPPHAQVNDNVFVSDRLPRLSITLDPRFQYLGNFTFDIQGIAGGYRYLWGMVDHDKHLQAVFIVQVEGFYPDSDGSYDYGTPNPTTLAGDVYQHNVWIYDNDQSARRQPGNESDLTRKFMIDRGYQWEPQLIMSRYARTVDASRKNEIILFYFENLSAYTSKRVQDFPEPPVEEEKRIVTSVEEDSQRAFAVSRDVRSP